MSGDGGGGGEGAEVLYREEEVAFRTVVVFDEFGGEGEGDAFVEGGGVLASWPQLWKFRTAHRWRCTHGCCQRTGREWAR